MSAVIYARKSSESEDRQIQSLGDQLAVLRGLARELGISIETEFLESKSAKDPFARPEFERLVTSIEQGTVTEVFTWALNRLSRNPVDGGRIAHLLQKGKLNKIVTPTKVYDSEDSPLLLAVENGMSTAFIQDLSRNVKRGLASKVAKGWAPCRAKIGYKNNLETHEIDTDPEAFPLLQRGWQLFLEGWTVAAVEDYLRSLGLVHKQRGKPPIPLRRHYFYRILNDPFYAGSFRYNGVWHRGAHKAMVTESEFAMAQSILRSKPTRAGKHAPKRFLFGGMFRCAHCGCAITAQIKRKRGKDGEVKATYTYYHCTGYKGCKKTAISENQLASGIAELVGSIALPEWLTELAKADVARLIERDAADLSETASDLEAKIDGLRSRLSKLLNLHLDDGIDREEFERSKSMILSEKREAEKRLKDQETYIDQCMGYLDQHLQKCLRANDYTIRPHEALLVGVAQSLRSEIRFVPGGVKFEQKSPLGEITRFRPLILSSVSRENSDSRTSNFDWQAFCEHLHTLARLRADA
jgi:site-specific DNA recombinase